MEKRGVTWTRSDFLTSHSTVRLEGARRSKFAEFMTHHVLSDVYGHKCLSVVHAESVADEVRRDGRATGPSLDRLLRTGFDRLLDLLE